MTSLQSISNSSRLKSIARTRLRLPFHSGLVGRLLGAKPLSSRTPLSLIQASSRLSQGTWLAQLAATACKRAGGRPIQTVELGTCVGISGMYLLAGMSEGSGGHLTTFEGDPESAELARHHFNAFLARFNLTNVSFEIRIGRFEQTVAPFFEAVETPLDLVFIDGNHQEHPTLDYHNMTMKRISERGIVVHDDIAWSEGMIRAWSEIKSRESCRIEEMLLGNRPSRGVLYVGSEAIEPIPQHHFDSSFERTLRHLAFKLRRSRPPN